jgi:CPA1 family monovalent cation:H+ antiporter
MAVLTWAGLRGGVSIALALTLPESEYRGRLLIVCYTVVVFSMLLQGLTMPEVIRRLYGRRSART